MKLFKGVTAAFVASLLVMGAGVPSTVAGETASTEAKKSSVVVLGSRKFKAVHDLRPMHEFDFSVEGEVKLDSGGHGVSLEYIDPQGINETILMLELVIEERGGTDAPEWYPVGYGDAVEDARYESVEIYYKDELIETTEVKVLE